MPQTYCRPQTPKLRQLLLPSSQPVSTGERRSRGRPLSLDTKARDPINPINSRNISRTPYPSCCMTTRDSLFSPLLSPALVAFCMLPWCFGRCVCACERRDGSGVTKWGQLVGKEGVVSASLRAPKLCRLQFCRKRGPFPTFLAHKFAGTSNATTGVPRYSCGRGCRTGRFLVSSIRLDTLCRKPMPHGGGWRGAATRSLWLLP